MKLVAGGRRMRPISTRSSLFNFVSFSLYFNKRGRTTLEESIEIFRKDGNMPYWIGCQPIKGGLCSVDNVLHALRIGSQYSTERDSLRRPVRSADRLPFLLQ